MLPLQATRRRFTVAEYHLMVDAGILTEDDRVELLAGEIIQMTPIGHRHASTVRRLNRLLATAFGDAAEVDVQNPIALDESSEPQPDLALLRPSPDFYRSGHPRPADVLLLVEVAESSIQVDREVKVPLYARASIAEIWLVDLNEDVVVDYREPSALGYRTVRTWRRGESLAPLAFPKREIAIAEILG